MKIMLHDEKIPATYEMELERPEGNPPKDITFKDVPYHYVGRAGATYQYSNATTDEDGVV